ncbi:MAG: HU family DNA-binding protein [Phycisphaerales bacterium]
MNERSSKTTATKKDLIDKIVAETNLKRSDVKKTVQAFLDGVIEELGDGKRLEFRDFGVFEVRQRASRTAQNPKTLEPVDIPAHKTVKFKVGRLMRESIGDSNGVDHAGEDEATETAAFTSTAQRRRTQDTTEE